MAGRRRRRAEAAGGGEDVPGDAGVVYKHVGPFDQLGRSYRLMSEVMERQGLTPVGEPIEIYETDPEDVTDPNEYVTFIQWPIAEGGTWPPDTDHFIRRVE